MWEIENSDQSLTFLLGLALGLVFALLYDVFKAYRMSAGLKTAAVAVCDFIYCIICTFFAFCFLMLRTNGQPRGYVFFALILGFLLWRLTLSRFFFGALRFIIRAIFVFYTRISRAFRCILSQIGGFFVKNIKKFTETLKKGLKGVKRLVYNLFIKKNENEEL